MYMQSPQNAVAAAETPQRHRRGLYGLQFSSSVELLRVNERLPDEAICVLEAAFGQEMFKVHSKYYLSCGRGVSFSL